MECAIEPSHAETLEDVHKKKQKEITIWPAPPEIAKN